RMLRLHRILAGTAMALVLAATSGADAGPVRKLPDTKVTTPATRAAAPAGESPAPNAVPAAPAPDTPAPAVAKPDAAPDTAAPAPQAGAETTPPDPLASLDPADRPIAEKIRDLLAAKVDKIFTTKKEHAAVEMFYQNRNLAPLWTEKGVENARARLAIARLKM